MTTVTILIVPRERYSGVLECIDTVYENTEEEFTLLLPDVGYPKHLLAAMQRRIANIPDARIVSMGMITPIDVMKQLLPNIDTDMMVWIETDTVVSKGWLPPLIKGIENGAAIVSPLVLEKAGVDQGAEIRNHLYTSEIRVVDVEAEDYLIEYKLYRRELAEDLPNEIRDTETFELHGVAFQTEALRGVDIPDMVMREQIDICMQLRAQGKKVIAVPQSVVLFDNLNTRMQISDMKYFFFRWSQKLNAKSARLFYERWGYRFYSEQAMYNWAFRRKVFLICRFFSLPIPVANKTTGAFKRLFCKEWDPLPDPVEASRHLLKEIGSPPPKLS